jgi:hypothetical protein
MFETQLVQFAATNPTYDFEKIPGHPEISFENINAVITRDGKSTRDLPFPNHAGRAKKARVYNPEPEALSYLGGGPPQGNVYLALSPFSITLHKRNK